MASSTRISTWMPTKVAWVWTITLRRRSSNKISGKAIVGIFLRLSQDLQSVVVVGQGLAKCTNNNSVKPITVPTTTASHNRTSTWEDEASNILSRCKRVLKTNPWCFPNNQHAIKTNLVPSVQSLNNTAICTKIALKIAWWCNNNSFSNRTTLRSSCKDKTPTQPMHLASKTLLPTTWGHLISSRLKIQSMRTHWWLRQPSTISNGCNHTWLRISSINHSQTFCILVQCALYLATLRVAQRCDWTSTGPQQPCQEVIKTSTTCRTSKPIRHTATLARTHIQISKDPRAPRWIPALKSTVAEHPLQTKWCLLYQSATPIMDNTSQDSSTRTMRMLSLFTLAIRR